MKDTVIKSDLRKGTSKLLRDVRQDLDAETLEEQMLLTGFSPTHDLSYTAPAQLPRDGIVHSSLDSYVN